MYGDTAEADEYRKWKAWSTMPDELVIYVCPACLRQSLKPFTNHYPLAYNGIRMNCEGTPFIEEIRYHKEQ